MSVAVAPARLARLLVAMCLTLLTVAGLSFPAQAATPMVDVTCTSQVAYGGELDCTAASIDSSGNYGVPGTFAFDPGHVLPVTWDHPTCAVDKSSCQVAGQVAVVPGAGPRTVVFHVDFSAAGSPTVTSDETVELTLVPTITSLRCDATELPIAGSTHCVVSAVDQLYDGAPLTPARLPSLVAGMTATSSDPGDVLTYDHPSSDGSTCVAAVVDGALQCGFAVRLDGLHGLHRLTATYGGNPATDEVSSQANVALSDGPRVAPIVTLGCPSSVPARHPQTICTVTVSPGGAGGVTPAGTVTLDQAHGPPPADAVRCTLSGGACTVAYEVFEGTVQLPPPPVRATYSGDGNYLPATAFEQVTVVPTPSAASLTCDRTVVPVGSSVHCTLSVATVDGDPVPVGPSDALLVTTTVGSISCDLPAGLGCGHVLTATATVAGFTLHTGTVAGPLLVTGSYTGDAFSMIAGSSRGLALTTIGDVPPVIGLGNASTWTSLRCSSTVAYLHAVSCLVSVAAIGVVPAGSVRLADANTAHPAFGARSCTLSVKGECTVLLRPTARPGSRVTVLAGYSGGAGFQPSTALFQFRVRAVHTSVVVRCAHAFLASAAVVHCEAAVRTEFGKVPGVPARSPAEVTVTARADGIAYDGGRMCHWRTSGHALTCGFTIKVRVPTTVHVYYRGSAKAHDARSRGATTIKLSRAA